MSDKKECPIRDVIYGEEFNNLLHGLRTAPDKDVMDIIEKKKLVKEYILDLFKRRELIDRFFLEEIVHRIKNDDRDYFKQLSKDWLQELVQRNPMTEDQRENYVSSVLGWKKGEDFRTSAYFKNEKQLKKYLGID